jgi:hypothetical protein
MLNRAFVAVGWCGGYPTARKGRISRPGIRWALVLLWTLGLFVILPPHHTYRPGRLTAGLGVDCFETPGRDTDSDQARG